MKLVKYALGTVLIMIGLYPMFVIMGLTSALFAATVAGITLVAGYRLIHQGIVETGLAIDWQAIYDYIDPNKE